MKIGLYIDNSYTYNCGPLKVFLNLKKGLENIGYSIVVNAPGDMTGCLHHSEQLKELHSNTPVGPNLFLWPADKPVYFSNFKNFVIPSSWVAPIYTSSSLFKDHKIYVWSVGIDTNLFNIVKTPNIDCLVYYKNRSKDELAAVIDMLCKNNQSSRVIEYGKYSENNLLEELKACRYVLLLTNTESQGIGYMEILSTNTPCFVFNKNMYHNFQATSVPYFDSLCGVISDFNRDYNSEFVGFLGNLYSYKPREYIVSNHTLELSAKRYIDILMECK